MERPIVDPSIPYVGSIPAGAFKLGRLIRIQGNTPGVAYRFDINLQCGPETIPRDDIAMHVSVRILDGFITINSLQNGVWGEEQQGGYQPVKRAERFEIILMCEANKYKVAINGQHFAYFPQRIHYDCITHLTIEGDVCIDKITYEGASFPIAPAVSPHTSVLLRQRDDDFEIINTHKPADVGFVHPPSYLEAAHGHPYSGLPPYPINDIKGMPQPYSTGAPSYPPQIHPHSPADVSGVPYSPPDGMGAPHSSSSAQIPLNAGDSSNMRSEKAAPSGKVGIFVCMLLSVLLGVVLLTMVMFVA